MTDSFLPIDFKVTDWGELQPFFQALMDREVLDLDALHTWMRDRNQLAQKCSDDFADRYIKMNIDTRDEGAKERFMYFVEQLQPKITEWSNTLDKKLVSLAVFKDLPAKYDTYRRSVKSQLKLFRPENIPLETEIEKLSQQFGAIVGQCSVTHNGEILTLPQAQQKLQLTDRAERKAVFKKLAATRGAVVEKLDRLFDSLLKLRQEVAQNAGFDNYRDYRFAELGRFDWGVSTCENFHCLVQKEVVPLIKKIHSMRAEKLGLDQLMPWDLDVDPSGKTPLQPFETADELIDKTTTIFNALNPEYGQLITAMKTAGRFDLDSKPGKAPGGFQYPLFESGLPFIYMNSVGSQLDVETMVHEGGHALHTYYSNNLEYMFWRNTPSEVAELASMSMELLSMPYWGEFYKDADDLARAKVGKLEDAVMSLPAIARGDEFQHWIYENPDHTASDRHAKWAELSEVYGTGMVDFAGFEDYQAHAWQNVLHFFEIPFYYIEYGLAQLGALQLWEMSLQSEKKALRHYEAFMKIGYQQSVPDIYNVAGINFDFDVQSIKRLVNLVATRLDL